MKFLKENSCFFNDSIFVRKKKVNNDYKSFFLSKKKQTSILTHFDKSLYLFYDLQNLTKTTIHKIRKMKII